MYSKYRNTTKYSQLKNTHPTDNTACCHSLNFFLHSFLSKAADFHHLMYIIVLAYSFTSSSHPLQGLPKSSFPSTFNYGVFLELLIQISFSVFEVVSQFYIPWGFWWSKSPASILEPFNLSDWYTRYLF